VTQERVTRGRVAALALTGLALTALLILWGPDLYRLLVDRRAVQEWVAGFGPWGPLVSIFLNAAQVLLAPIPGQTVGLVNGYLYGVGLGTLYSFVGVELGTLLAMLLARRFGRPLVAWLVGRELLHRWDRISRKQGPVFFFLVFLFPFVPDDVAAFVVGLSPLSIPYMLLLAGVGRLPGLVVASWVGASAAELPWWGWGIIGLGGMALALLFWRCHDRLEEGVLALIRRVTGRPEARG